MSDLTVGPETLAKWAAELGESEFVAANSMHQRLAAELGNTAAERGRYVELANDPDMTFYWEGHQARLVTYKISEDPYGPSTLTIYSPTRKLGAGLNIGGSSLFFTPHRATLTISSPEVVAKSKSAIPEVGGTAAYRFGGSDPLRFTYNGLYWALRQSGATISGPAVS